MPRKGTSYLFKIGFPTPQPAHRSVETKKPNFKDNLEHLDPSLEPDGLPLPAPPAPALNADGNEVRSNEYYQTGLSTIESCITSAGEKVGQAVANPDISVSSVKKIARKLGRDQIFLKSVKENLLYLRLLCMFLTRSMDRVKHAVPRKEWAHIHV